MDISRAEGIANIIKTTRQLGKNIKKPGTIKDITGLPGTIGPSGLPKAVEGSGVLKVLMYIVAGLLLLGLLLLGIDQWITPIFIRRPGDNGYIPIPGTDTSQVYWQTTDSIADITIGTPIPPTVTAGSPTPTPPLFTTVIEGQSGYSITMDVFIQDESIPKNFTSSSMLRTFFMLGTPSSNGISVPSSILSVSLDPTINKVYITVYDPNSQPESATIDNVPIHKSFRIGVVKSPFILEAYLNGKLVMTKQLTSISKTPNTGDRILAPANIKDTTGLVLSQNIKVMNVRTFGYMVSPSEMMGRMNDLITKPPASPSWLGKWGGPPSTATWGSSWSWWPISFGSVSSVLGPQAQVASAGWG